MARTVELSVPDIGNFKDIPVIEVLVAPGQSIAKDAPLVTLESEKATMEVPSSSAGTIKDVRVKVGDKVSQGVVLATAEVEDAVSGADAAAPAPAAPVAPIAPVPPVAAVAVATVRSPGTFAFAPDQLARDIADIEQARDAIIAAEATGVFVLPATRRRKPSTGVLRRHDAVPVLIGAMLALLVLIGYGAIASIAALGR